MDPGRFARVKEILIAVRHQPADSQESFLRLACGNDPSLLLDIQSLLRQATLSLGAWNPVAGIEQDNRLDQLLSEFALHRAPAQIGPYRVVGYLGVGGMGIVYRAEQFEPVRREVALKVMRAVPESISQLARFQSECRALARLNHPNIAHVFDAGSDDEGRPFIVMELIEGIPITKFCDRERLSTRARLEITQRVCWAVQHAHQRGIIHRDLKPSNVLVAKQDGNAVPKIIDFGIAKMVEETRASASARTRTGQFLGTLEYASPERLTGSPEDVATGVDVYSLGVILYELLTGRLPFETGNRPVAAAVRAITESPPRPFRLRESRSRRSDGDLEIIVQTALEKDPERRYSGAAAMADDIGRHLSFQPIQARPPTALYQIRKLIRRQRVPAALLAVLVLMLVAFGITMSFLAGEASRGRLKAQTEAERAAVEATRARKALEFVETMLASPRPSEKGPEVTVREVLDQAVLDLDNDPSAEPVVRAAVRRTIGKTYLDLGLADSAAPQLRTALREEETQLGADHPDVAATHDALVRAYIGLGDFEAALIHARRSLSIRKDKEDADSPEVARSYINLASVIRDRGNFSTAESLLRRVVFIQDKQPDAGRSVLISALDELAVTLDMSGRPEEAEITIRRALDLARTDEKDRQPWFATALANLAQFLNEQGKHEEAEVAVRQALEIGRDVLGEDHRMVGGMLNILGNILRAEGRYPEAEEALQEVVDRRRIQGNPGTIAAGLNNLGLVLLCRNDYRRAEKTFREALDLWKQVYGEEHPYIAITLGHLGSVLAIQGDLDAGKDLLSASLAMHSKLLDPGHPWIGGAKTTLACVLLDGGRAEDAEELAGDAWRILEEAAGAEDVRTMLAVNAVGSSLAMQGRPAEADSLIESSLAIILPSPAVPHAFKARALRWAVEHYQRWGRAERAVGYKAELRRLTQSDSIPSAFPEFDAGTATHVE